MSDPEDESEVEYDMDRRESDELRKIAGEEEPEENPLTLEMLAEGLSLLCKTGNALAHAYVRVDLKDRELTDINALRTFIHLRYVDVSHNVLRDLSPLANLSHLLWLSGDNNMLASAYIEELPFLQVASLAHNQILSTEDIAHPLLERLNLAGNQIHEVTGLDPLKLSRLHTLELRGNLLQSTCGINLPSLQSLYLAGNSISKLEGLECLVNLQTLHLRDNHIESLVGFSETMVSLQYINLRGNLIVNIGEVKNLQCLPTLRALVLAENPCTEEDSHRTEALVLLRKLERLDKDPYTVDERAEADDLQKHRQKLRQQAEANENQIPGMEE